MRSMSPFNLPIGSDTWSKPASSARSHLRTAKNFGVCVGVGGRAERVRGRERGREGGRKGERASERESVYDGQE